MESIESLNQRLIDYFGIDTVNGLPMYRIVWADDQFEKRLVATLDSGVQLIHPEVRTVPKYPYLKHLYVLERLVLVSDYDKTELAGASLSYEPIFAYKQDDGTSIPPVWVATKFIVDTLHAALGKKSLRKYIEPTDNKEERIDKLQEELFGDESGLLGKTFPSVGEGIIVPQNYSEEN